MGLPLHQSEADLLPLSEFRHAPKRSRSYKSPRTLARLATLQQAGCTAHKLTLLDAPRRGHRVDRRRVQRTTTAWLDDRDEGRELARSDVPLPTDWNRLARRPSLEREEAFRDPATTKRLARWGDDDEVAELYRLGLLYDDEHLRGEGFGFHTLSREEPAYVLRHSKRAKKLNRARGLDPDLDLALQLSFAELAHDDAITRYLISTASDDETIQHRPEDDRSSLSPLRIIYELIGSNPSLLPSQCPDLVSDSDPDEWAVLPIEGDDEERGTTQFPEDEDAADAWIVLGDGS